MYERLRVDRSTTVDRVVDALRDALFAGDLEPGTPLREQPLAEALGVARSTVREAMTMLVTEGLAIREPNKGVSVAILHPSAVADICRARFVLESAGIRAWYDADEVARERVRQAMREFAATAKEGADPEAMTETHLAIHRSLVALTGSARLIATQDSITAEARLALARVDQLRQDAKLQVASHRKLIRLLEKGDLDEAVAELDRHLAGAQESLLEAITTPPA
ncbi:DNA-binding GntR family transcriptional regulator [Kribbella amoyensis]|uniref:DNA-binding GntR family transcriptional regulator n=1 Tax=Kribbella amoyensis TaxID=996641 RepID=A0A561BNE1_9ACTN|nr:GntR family transcriptional regulator [Kribbella amoyensis]TWD80367.1 DNA-binding GntR family transcriptional regulator [Kribbella amoyensis]